MDLVWVELRQRTFNILNQKLKLKFNNLIVYLFPEGKSKNFFVLWMFAQITTTIAGIISYPLDTVRRRMMMQSGRSDILYRNAFDCFIKMYKNEGSLSFFKGQTANIVRGLGWSLLLVLYDKFQEIFHINFN